jgi:pyruvate formate lyase activating enzyme
MSGIELHPAAHWRPENGAVRCELCPHRCLISEGKRGICKVREHQKGRLFALTYGKVSAVQFDPMEKKPLYHFHPGKPILSIGSVGCNFHCGFCQNHHLVECAAPLAPVPIPDLVRAARREGAVGISYTYNEPLIWFEFVVDCAREFRKAGMANVLVTNGFVSPEPLAELLPLVDAMNIDLKSMDPEFYRKICGGSLAPVLATIEKSAKETHVEITNLLVTGENDSEESIRSVVDFVAGVDPEIPLHLTAVRLCGELSSGGGRGHRLPGMRGDRRQEKPIPHQPFRSYREPVCLLLRIPPFRGIK